MELHFDDELAELKQELLRMSALAEQSLDTSLKALVERSSELVKAVDDLDPELDQLEMDIDERCVQLIALRQPKASDLRLIIMAMKISGELERISDQAVNIAHRVRELNKEPQLKPYVDIPRMADHARGMIHEAMDAFVYGHASAAREVIKRDEAVDLLCKQLFRELTSFMVEDPGTITRALNLMSVAKNLERIADHATNIAEEIVYLYEARDIRHQSEPDEPAA